MRFRFAILVYLTGAGLSVWAQEQPPATPAAPVWENTGKPIVVGFQCTADDIQWAGLSCTEEAPCAVYLELTAASGAGNKYFAAGNIHTDAVTLYSVLLGSEDAGRTWREITNRIRGSGLDHLQFVDADTGWAGGQQLFPLPQEPFVMFTTDGGKTWRQQAILGENVENHFGSLHALFFATTKTDGSAVIDRGQGGNSGPYLLYGSPNGGESWQIEEESRKVLSIKNAPKGPGDWRVRADGATKAYQFESRRGENWTAQAAFAVNLGVCKPQQ